MLPWALKDNSDIESIGWNFTAVLFYKRTTPVTLLASFGSPHISGPTPLPQRSGPSRALQHATRVRRSASSRPRNHVRTTQTFSLPRVTCTSQAFASAMDVLEHIPEFRVVVCKLCKTAVYPSALRTHLRRAHPRYSAKSVSEEQFRSYTRITLPSILEHPLLDPRSEKVITPRLDQTPIPCLSI